MAGNLRPSTASPRSRIWLSQSASPTRPRAAPHRSPSHPWNLIAGSLAGSLHSCPARCGSRCPRAHAKRAKIQGGRLGKTLEMRTPDWYAGVRRRRDDGSSSWSPDVTMTFMRVRRGHRRGLASGARSGSSTPSASEGFLGCPIAAVTTTSLGGDLHLLCSPSAPDGAGANRGRPAPDGGADHRPGSAPSSRRSPRTGAGSAGCRGRRRRRPSGC